MYGAHISHSGAPPTGPSSEGFDWFADQRLLKVEPAVLQTANISALTCRDVPYC
jgi:hypothetical protein